MTAHESFPRSLPSALDRRFPVALDQTGPVRIGLVVFDEDTTTEEVLGAYPLAQWGVAAHVARMPLPLDLSEKGLRRTADDLADAAQRLIPSSALHAIGYSCTVGTLELGHERVREAIGRGRPGVPVATPITGAVKAFAALGVTRIALLTPYGDVRTRLIIDHLAAAGIETVAGGAFLAVEEVDYARISHDSLRAAARGVFTPNAEALFISCTALRGTDLIGELEGAFRRPVVTSTQALLWEALGCAGVRVAAPADGRLFALGGASGAEI
jgi:maleate isomerase